MKKNIKFHFKLLYKFTIYYKIILFNKLILRFLLTELAFMHKLILILILIFTFY